MQVDSQVNDRNVGQVRGIKCLAYKRPSISQHEHVLQHENVPKLVIFRIKAPMFD